MSPKNENYEPVCHMFKVMIKGEHTRMYETALISCLRGSYYNLSQI